MTSDKAGMRYNKQLSKFMFGLLILSIILISSAGSYAGEKKTEAEKYPWPQIMNAWNLMDGAGVLVQIWGSAPQGQNRLEFALIDYSGSLRKHHSSFLEQGIYFERLVPFGGFVFRMKTPEETTVLGSTVKALSYVDLRFDARGEPLDPVGPVALPRMIGWPPGASGTYDLVYLDRTGGTSSFRELSGFNFNPHLLDPPGFKLTRSVSADDVHVICVRSADEMPLLSRITRAEFIAWFPERKQVKSLFDGPIAGFLGADRLYDYDPLDNSITMLRLAENQPKGWNARNPGAQWVNVGVSEPSSIRMINLEDVFRSQVVRFDLDSDTVEVLAEDNIRVLLFRDHVGWFFTTDPARGVSALFKTSLGFVSKVYSIEGEILSMSFAEGGISLSCRDEKSDEVRSFRYLYSRGEIETVPRPYDGWTSQKLLLSDVDYRFAPFAVKPQFPERVFVADFDEYGRGWYLSADPDGESQYFPWEYWLLRGFEEEPVSINRLLRDRLMKD